MMKLNVDENPGRAARYGIPALVVLLATLFWLAPAALALHDDTVRRVRGRHGLERRSCSAESRR
jgi:hypothetical protein